jgi:predicted aldo/keto reductase-like oxidoreductase
MAADCGSRSDRRDFLKKTAAGIVGAAISPAFLAGAAAETPAQDKHDKQDKMERRFVRRTLGKTGIELPVVNMGVMNADNPELVRAALDAGIVLLDTAHYYQRGRNEEMIGEVIKGRPRDSFVIATKVLGSPIDNKTGLYGEDATEGPFIEKFETSLKRLGLEHVEILYLHNVVSRGGALHEPYLNAFARLKDQGKIRFAGVTTHRNEPEVIRAAKDSGVYDVVLTAYNFRQPHAAEVEKAMKEAADAGLGVVVMKTQAGVYWDSERRHPINMRAALKWAIRHEFVHTAIPGFTTFDQMELDLSVMNDITLTPAEEIDLKEDSQTGLRGLYCDQCGTCTARCPHRLEIPTLMRSYMYAYGYRNLAAAKETFESAGILEIPCGDCAVCLASCAMGLDIKERASAIARIRDVADDFIV